ncbi:MAG TPA: hypothetical protein DCF68_02490 [Cyanothece sp. UBA12306]|nr:hypothetical protein [Cyanothece sp. UBA12306]
MNNFKKLQRTLELILWNFRFFTLIPVLFSLLSAVKFFVLGTIEIMMTILPNSNLFQDSQNENLTFVISSVVGGIDYYLIGIILLIFSFGIYEIFISKITIDGDNPIKSPLIINSLEELKKKLIQVIIMALIVSLFKKIIVLQLTTTIDAIYIAVAILLVSASTYLGFSQE